MNDVTPKSAPRSRFWLIVAGLLLVFASGAVFWTWFSDTYLATLIGSREQPISNGNASIREPLPSDIVVQPGQNAQAVGLEILESRLRLLEQTRASSAAASALPAGTERLILILAARRAMERGAPHDQIAQALAGSFGDQTKSLTDAVVANAGKPAGTAELAADFEKIAAPLGSKSGESWFDALTNMAVIRQKSAAVKTPSELVEAARTALKSGDTAASIKFIAQHPARDEAKPWLDKARKTVAEARALDALEQLAFSQPQPATVQPPPPNPAATEDESSLPSVGGPPPQI
jgi:hypothetical protein